MYLGNLSSECRPAYYLPLLSIMKKRNNPAEQELIAELDALNKIEILNKDNSWGFPDECNSLFSHGGYSTMYKTLDNGLSCLALRNLTGSMKDEEGRSTPFNLLFIAEDNEDNLLLDNVAVYCLDHSEDVNRILSPTIVYDPSVNGLRADLHLIYDWLISCPVTRPLQHNKGQVNYIMVQNPQVLPIALKEHKLIPYLIDAVFLETGQLIKGNLKYAAPILSKEVIADVQHIDSTTICECVHNDDNEIILMDRADHPVHNSDFNESGVAIKYIENDDNLHQEYVRIFNFSIPVDYVKWIILGTAIVSFIIGLII